MNVIRFRGDYNMIDGDARRELATKGCTFEGGLPGIIIGQGHVIESMTKGPTVTIPFTLDGAVRR